MTYINIKVDTGRKFDHKNLDGIMNEMEADGWKLVSLTPITYNCETDYLLLTFKKP